MTLNIDDDDDDEGDEGDGDEVTAEEIQNGDGKESRDLPPPNSAGGKEILENAV